MACRMESRTRDAGLRSRFPVPDRRRRLVAAHPGDSHVLEKFGEMQVPRHVGFLGTHQGVEQLQEPAVCGMIHRRAVGLARALQVLDDDRAPGLQHVHHPLQHLLGLVARPLGEEESRIDKVEGPLLVHIGDIADPELGIEPLAGASARPSASRRSSRSIPTTCPAVPATRAIGNVAWPVPHRTSRHLIPGTSPTRRNNASGFDQATPEKNLSRVACSWPR